MAIAQSPSAPLPGPRTVPGLGWWLSMVNMYRNPLSYLRMLSKKYGNVVSLSNGKPSHICVFGPELNFQLLSQPDIFEVSVGPFSKMVKETPLMRIGGSSLQVMHGEKHRQQRRLMQPAFHRQQVEQYRNDMVDYTQRMLDSWQGQSEVQFYRAMELLTRRIVVKSLFGLEDEEEIERLGALFERLVSSMPLALALPLPVPGTPYMKIQRLSEQLETTLQNIIARKRLQQDAHDLLAVLIHERDDDGTMLNDRELISHAFTLFSAGHSTTSVALTWTIFLLSQHPQSYQTLRDELSGVLHGDAPRVDQIRQLSYLDAVIKESLRLLSPALIGIRNTIAPCQLGGYDLPQNATVVYSEVMTHRLPELYEEPDRFLPERWFTLKRTAYEYLPFSAGQHRCIGAEFAIQEARLAVAMMVQHYQFQVRPDTTLNLDLTMHPKGGLPMRLLPLDQQPSVTPVKGNIHQFVSLPR